MFALWQHSRYPMSQVNIAVNSKSLLKTHESSWCNGCSLFVQYFVKTCITEWVWLHIHTWACLNWWPINAGSCQKMLNMCRLSSSFCYCTIFCLVPFRSTDIFFFSCTISKLTSTEVESLFAPLLLQIKAQSNVPLMSTVLVWHRSGKCCK